MRIDDLQKKVEAAELKVEKCRKTIERHTAQMEKKAKQLRDMGIDPDTADIYAYAQQNNKEVYWLLCDYDQKQDDIKGATRKLAEAERILKGWREKLDLQINLEKVIQDQVPQVIKDFLQKWKEDAFDWYVKRHASFLVFKADLRSQERAAKVEALKTLPEYAEKRERLGEKLWMDDFYISNPWPRKPMEDFLKARELDYNSIQKRISFFADGTILKMCAFRNDQERLDWLDSTLEEEKKNKTLDLMARVTKITGPVTDVKGLKMYAGDLNGVVLGEKGAAKVQTISAGGYNIQCFHYRCLIDDVTKKYMAAPEKKPSLDSIIKTASKKQEPAASIENRTQNIPER